MILQSHSAMSAVVVPLNIPPLTQAIGVKSKNAIDCGLSVIICIGELPADRDSGSTMVACSQQLAAVKAALTEGDWKSVAIAYEPGWATSENVTVSPHQVQETHAAIRQWISANISAEVAVETRIIYGGPVSAAGCQELYSQPDVNGFLVGAASMKEEFVEIINVTASRSGNVS